MSERFVAVAVEQTTLQFDRLFHYHVPEQTPLPAVGCRVAVPFGKGNRARTGFVLAHTAPPAGQETKPLLAVLDAAPVLTPELAELAFYLKEHTFCPLYDACRAMLPAGLQLQLARRYRALPAQPEGQAALLSLSPGQRHMLAALQKSGRPQTEQQLLARYGLPPAELSLRPLVEAGLLACEQAAVRRLGDATEKTLRLNDEAALSYKLTPRQQAVVELLEQTGPLSLKEVCYFAGVTPAVPQALVKKGALTLFEQPVYRMPAPAAAAEAPAEITLSDDQQAAYRTLLALLRQKEGAAALLYGVTGSGKTSVYLKLIDEARRAQPAAGVIVMVPEIALTPQTMAIFQRRYGQEVAIFHSRLSPGERLDEWKRVREGKAHIAVGTRSAVFAPFETLSLIVMDEEQEHTYQSEASPRYHARSVARFRAARQGALLVLASATPSVNSFAKAKAGTYTLCRLPRRYGAARLPAVSVVDMRAERLAGNLSVFSEFLIEKLRETLAAGQQAVLLLNRRGYHTFVGCAECGAVLECPSCSLSLNYHRDNNRLMCHTCGYTAPLPQTCPTCGGPLQKTGGVGTQKAEEQLLERLPGARVLRMDADSTLSRSAHGDKLAAFQKGEYDILLGTQMVAKGLDFPRVTLVGVLGADSVFHQSDYRAPERGFALLTQVIGRAGRAGGGGEAVIQTAEPDQELIDLARRQDYDAFFEEEMALRRITQTPPFCDMCVVGFSNETAAGAEQAAAALLTAVKQLVAQTKDYADLPLKVLGPAPAPVVRQGGRYRYHLTIKCRNSRAFRQMLLEALRQLGAERAHAGTSVWVEFI